MNTTPQKTTRPPCDASRPSALRRVLHAGLQVGAGIFAFVLMLVAMVLGVALAMGVVVWTLLRGRRPAPGVLRSTYQRAWRPRATPEADQVVDVEVREVAEPDRR